MDQVSERSSKIPKFRFPDRDNGVLAVAFAIFVVMLVIVMALMSEYTTPVDDSTQPTPDQFSLQSATWTIDKVEPTGDDFTLTLKSSLGNIRTYEDIQTYGLSNDRQYLAVFGSTGLELIDLRGDDATKIETPFSYSSTPGEVISWSHDSEYFAFSVYREQDQTKPHILLFKKDGTNSNFAVNVVSEGGEIAPVKFSSSFDLMLVRTFNQEDKLLSPTSPTDQLPAELTLFSRSGEEVMAIEVGELSGSQTLVYTWDQTGTKVLYLVTERSAEVNFSDVTQFTVVSVSQ